MEFYTMSLHNGHIEKIERNGPLASFYENKKLKENEITLYPAEKVWCVASASKKELEKVKKHFKANKMFFNSRCKLDCKRRKLEDFFKNYIK